MRVISFLSPFCVVFLLFSLFSLFFLFFVWGVEIGSYPMHADIKREGREGRTEGAASPALLPSTDVLKAMAAAAVAAPLGLLPGPTTELSTDGEA